MTTSRTIVIVLAALLLAIPAAADRSDGNGTITPGEQDCFDANKSVSRCAVVGGTADGDVSGAFDLKVNTTLINNRDGLYDGEGFSEGTFILYSGDRSTYRCNVRGYAKRVGDEIDIKGRVYPKITSAPDGRTLSGSIDLQINTATDPAQLAGTIDVTRFCRCESQRSGMIRLEGKPECEVGGISPAEICWVTGAAKGNLSGYLDATFDANLTTVIINPGSTSAHDGAGFTTGRYNLSLLLPPPDQNAREAGDIYAYASCADRTEMEGMFEERRPEVRHTTYQRPYHGTIEGMINISAGKIEYAWLDFAGTALRIPGCGDVDEGGIVNVIDVRLLLNHVNDPTGYPVDPCAGNVNGEDGIDMADVRLLLAYVFDMSEYLLNCG